MSDVWLTTKDVAARLLISTRQVTILCANGSLRASKPTRDWRISEADLADYLDEKANRPRRKRRSRAA